MLKEPGPKPHHNLKALRAHVDGISSETGVNHISYHTVESVSHTVTERICKFRGDIFLPKYACANRVVDVVVNIGNFIRKADNSPLIGARRAVCSVVSDTVSHFQCQVEPLSALF